RRHTRSKRDWSSDVCSSDLYVDGKFSNRDSRRDPRLRRPGFSITSTRERRRIFPGIISTPPVAIPPRRSGDVRSRNQLVIAAGSSNQLHQFPGGRRSENAASDSPSPCNREQLQHALRPGLLLMARLGKASI